MFFHPISRPRAPAAPALASLPPPCHASSYSLSPPSPPMPNAMARRRPRAAGRGRSAECKGAAGDLAPYALAVAGGAIDRLGAGQKGRQAGSWRQ